MILKNTILRFPFQHSFIGFLLCCVMVTSVVLLGGNRPEYLAFFNGFVCITFLIISLKASYQTQILSLWKILSVPVLLLLFLFAIGYYRYWDYTAHIGHLSSVDITHFIIETGNFAPFAHFGSLAYWVSVFLMAILAFIAGHYSGFKRGFVKFFFAVSTLIAVYGIGVYATGNQTILWFPKDSYLGDLTATFINRNSYATFAGCGILAGLYCINQHYHRFMRDYQGTQKTQIAGLIDYMSGYGIINVVCVLLMSGALILTHSRAGISLTIGFCCLFYFFTAKQSPIKQRFKVLLGVIIVLSFIAPIIMQDVLIRAVDINDHSALRVYVYKILLKMIADYPVLGVGLGGFEYAFAAYRDHTVSISDYWDKAHSTFLEMILEIGIPMSVILALLYGYIVSNMIKSYRRYRQHFIILCLLILGLCISHSCVDFSLQIPAINIMFHIMLMLGYAESQKRI
jgi:O-antigen ligase